MTHQEHAIVTGGSSGIGLAAVRGLLDRGLAVTVFDQQPPPPLEGEFSGLLQDFRVDVTNEDEVRDAFAEAARHAGPVRRLVASHGIRGQFVPAPRSRRLPSRARRARRRHAGGGPGIGARAPRSSRLDRGTGLDHRVSRLGQSGRLRRGQGGDPPAGREPGDRVG